MKYYLIHNGDENRKTRMIEAFKKGNIDLNDVIWLIKPTKDDINYEFVINNVIPGISYTCNTPIDAQNTIGKGLMCCTYKHYLALKKIVESNEPYGVILEDNIDLSENMPSKLDIYIKQLNELYPDWDIIFDTEWQNPPVRYREGEIKKDIYVYPKTNEITNFCHGGTKCAQFYLLTLECAKKLYENYIPFNNAPDWWMNDLFRKLNIKSFWAEPSNVLYWKHTSSV